MERRSRIAAGLVLAAAMVATGSAAGSTHAQTYAPVPSPVNAPLDMGYEVSQGVTTPTDDTDKLPFEPGSVQAHWYQYFGFYVVRFVGLEMNTGYCAGTSTFVSGDFVSETNSPTSAPGDCPGAWPKAPSPLGAFECGGELVYRTAISTGTGGVLHATINKMLPTTGINGAGLTGSVAANLSTTPIIDLSACTMLVARLRLRLRRRRRRAARRRCRRPRAPQRCQRQAPRQPAWRRGRRPPEAGWATGRLCP